MTGGEVTFGFADPKHISVPGNRTLSIGQIMAEHDRINKGFRIEKLEAMAAERGVSLAAAADFMGPGVIEVPRFETEILDMVRRRGALGQRIRKVPATGQPSRYFEQRTIASGGFTDPRAIMQNPETPQRSERAITLKAISGQMNFGLFDVEVTRQQGMWTNLVGKDIEDLVNGMLRTSDEALWNGTDTDLSNPTTNQYVGGLTQINRDVLIGSGSSIVDGIKTEVASIISNRKFEAKPTAIYAHPMLIDAIEQEERQNHRQMSQIPVTNSKNEVIAGLIVSAISTAAGLLPLIPDWALPSPVTGASAHEAGKTDFVGAIVTEDLIEYHYLTAPDPRLFVLGLEGSLATQYVGVMFGSIVFKGKADPLNTPEVAGNTITYAHSQVTVVR